MSSRTAGHRSVAHAAFIALILAASLALPQPAVGADNGGEAGEAADTNGVAAEGEGPLELSLENCIALGVRQGLDYLTEEESYILRQLATSLERHNYGRLWTSTVSAETDSADTTTESGTVTLVKRLLTGGQLEVSGGSSSTSAGSGTADGAGDGAAGGGAPAGGEDDTYTSSLSVAIEQPLLRGAGRLVAREDLTQAERELVYAWRDLTLFRQQFVIDLVTKYYRLVQLQLEIANQQERVTSAEDLATLTLARLATGTASRIDMLRAVVNLLRTRNDLIDARQRYELQLDSLKLDLGLAMGRPVTIVPPATLPYRPTLEIRLDVPEALKESLRAMAEEAQGAAPRVETLQTDQAGRSVDELGRESITAALGSRLDLITARDEADDARRALRIARSNLRGDLNLTARAGYATEPATSFEDQRFGEPEWSVGLAYELPLDRVPERTSYRQQLIALTRAMRQTSRAQEQVLLDVRTTVRDLHRAETTVLIQQLNVVAAERRLERARADYDLGVIANRDVVEAQDELLQAKNALDRAKVDHIIATLQLEKDTGRLDPERWRELIR